MSQQITAQEDGWQLGVWFNGRKAELWRGGRIVARVLWDATGIHRHDYNADGKHILSRSFITFDDAINDEHGE